MLNRVIKFPNKIKVVVRPQHDVVKRNCEVIFFETDCTLYDTHFGVEYRLFSVPSLIYLVCPPHVTYYVPLHRLIEKM